MYLSSVVGASLTSPLGRCTMPAWSPSHGFLHHTIGPHNNATCLQTITDLDMLIQEVLHSRAYEER